MSSECYCYHLSMKMGLFWERKWNRLLIFIFWFVFFFCNLLTHVLELSSIHRYWVRPKEPEPLILLDCTSEPHFVHSTLYFLDQILLRTFSKWQRFVSIFFLVNTDCTQFKAVNRHTFKIKLQYLACKHSLIYRIVQRAIVHTNDVKKIRCE